VRRNLTKPAAVEPNDRRAYTSGHGRGTRVSKQGEEFEKLAEGENLPIWQEFLLFLSENKKWWLLPILIVLGLVGVLVVLGGGSGLAPFIYPIF
jgi:hypothetical protein